MIQEFPANKVLVEGTTVPSYVPPGENFLEPYQSSRDQLPLILQLACSATKGISVVPPKDLET